MFLSIVIAIEDDEAAGTLSGTPQSSLSQWLSGCSSVVMAIKSSFQGKHFIQFIVTCPLGFLLLGLVLQPFFPPLLLLLQNTTPPTLISLTRDSIVIVPPLLHLLHSPGQDEAEKETWEIL